jgi:tetraacyldisaccharide 4'-kinase
MAVAGFLSRRLEAAWYGPSSPHPLLLPLEAAFRRAAEARRCQFRDGTRTAERLPVPVIVVGNLSVGGTGKTPLTLWLAEFLAGLGYRPGIVSRGYGGKASAPLAVTPGSDPREAGDEPVLIAQRTGLPVAVFPRRAEAARKLLTENGCDLILADDGLQHYALARDIEIAVVDAARGFGNGHCLPAGPLREPPDRLQTVDLVVYNGPAPEGAYSMQLEGAAAVSLVDASRRRPLADFAESPLFALAGIGNPERFFAHLRRHGLRPETRAFPDHHPYRPEDLVFAGNAPLLMTEKDAVKCQGFAGPEHWFVPVEATLPAAFGERLTTLLKEIPNGRKTA